MGKRIKDLTGTRIEKGKVLRQVGTDKKRGILWECRCDKCGEIFIEGSKRLLAVHNEIHRRHGHKCAELAMTTKAAKAAITPVPGIITASNNPYFTEDKQRRLKIAKMWAEKRRDAGFDGLVEALRYTANRGNT